MNRIGPGCVTPDDMELTETPRYSPTWLELREPADAAARATVLLDRLRPESLRRTASGDLVVRDLGCGTGSMARWLSPRLPGPQHWVLQDRDAQLLAHAAATVAGPSATVETRCADLAGLTAADLRNTCLVTASALLDLLTADEGERLAAACVAAGCPALLTLSVTGIAELDPVDPLDDAVNAAFADHLRHGVDHRALLGPAAVERIVDAFERRGATVVTAPSPWRLGPGQRTLIERWLDGWVGAAVERHPDLDGAGYLRRRLADPDLRVLVHHTDLLALPPVPAQET
jgi:SAM-dependent methyltransferase